MAPDLQSHPETPIKSVVLYVYGPVAFLRGSRFRGPVLSTVWGAGEGSAKSGPMHIGPELTVGRDVCM